MIQPASFVGFYSYIRVVLLAAGFLILLLLSGATQPLHDYFYRLASALPVFSQANQNILLITVERTQLHGNQEFWRQLLNKVVEHNPRHITFATPPQELSLDYLEELAGSVPFTTALRPAIRPDGTLLDLDKAEQLLGTHYSHGWLLPIFWNRDGTLGYQRFVAEYPAALAAELVAAETGGIRLDDNFSTEFDLRVSTGADPLPNLNAQYIVDHGVVADLVTDKWVIIGQSQLYSPPATLMDDRPGLRDELELRGQILQSVIDRRIINHLPEWQALLGLASILLLSFYALTVFAHKPVLPLLVAWSLLMLCLAVGLLAIAELEIPVGLAIAAPFCTAAAMAGLRASALRRALDRLFPLTDTTASFYQERLARLTDAISLEDILELVWQTLQVKHAIILQLSDDNHLSPISHRGHPEDVLPGERDITNPPYATAFTHNHPVISTQPFFEPEGDSDVEYLCPLIYDGEKLGFWALSIARDNMQQIPHFEDVLRQYSAEISSLLYARNRARKSPALPSLTDQTPTHIKLEVLRRRAIAGESLLRYAQSILNTTDNSLLLYNLFGNLQFTNAAAELFANKFAIPVDALNALDLLSVLTGCSAAKGQDILLEIVIHNSSVSLPIILTGDITTHVVHLRGVAASSASATEASTRPFATQWVLFEIYDQSRFAQINLEQDNLVLTINKKIGDLASAARVKGLKIKDFLLENEKSLQDVIDLNHILTEIEKNSGKVERQLIAFEDIVANSYHFVEVKSAVQESVEKHRRQIELRNLTLQINLPDERHISRADNHELTRVLYQIWDLLLETASDGSTLSIDLQSVDDLGIMCTFDNEGYGLTSGIIGAFGRGEVSQLTPTLAALYFAARNVRQWPGSLTLECPVVGLLTVTLTLEGFTVHV